MKEALQKKWTKYENYRHPPYPRKRKKIINYVDYNQCMRRMIVKNDHHKKIVRMLSFGWAISTFIILIFFYIPELGIILRIIVLSILEILVAIAFISLIQKVPRSIDFGDEKIIVRFSFRKKVFMKKDILNISFKENIGSVRIRTKYKSIELNSITPGIPVLDFRKIIESYL